MARIFDLPETKGIFKVTGKVNGTSKDKYYTNGLTKKGKVKMALKFGIKVDGEGRTVYTCIEPRPKDPNNDKVYFYKKSSEKGKKGQTMPVVFSKRNEFNEEGFEQIGVKVGIKQFVDEKGQVKNNNINLFEENAIDYLKENLKEDQEVFARGDMDWSSYKNGNTGDIIRMTKYKITQISGLTKPLDFDKEGFVSMNDFKQKIIFMGIELDTSNKEDEKAILEAKIVTYNSIEDAEFVVRNKKLYKNLKKLKPYTALDVFGKINNIIEKEEEQEDDGWGSDNDSFGEGNNISFIKEMYVLGADPSTIDTETYTKQNVEEAIELIRKNNEAYQNFGENNNEDTDGGDWGSMNETSDDSNEIEEGWD